MSVPTARVLVLGAAVLVACAGSMGSRAGEVPAVGVPWAIDTPGPALADSWPRPDGAPLAVPLAGPLSLAALSDYALRHHPSTRQAWAGAPADLADPAALAPSAAASGVVRTVSPSLSMSWVLYDFGARTAGLDAAQTRRRAGLATVADTAHQAEAALADARLGALQAAAQSRSGAATLGLPVNTPLEIADDDRGNPNGDPASDCTTPWRGLRSRSGRRRAACCAAS